MVIAKKEKLWTFIGLGVVFGGSGVACPCCRRGSAFGDDEVNGLLPRFGIGALWADHRRHIFLSLAAN